MRVLLTGGSSLLGRNLLESKPDNIVSFLKVKVRTMFIRLTYPTIQYISCLLMRAIFGIVASALEIITGSVNRIKVRYGGNLEV